MNAESSQFIGPTADMPITGGELTVVDVPNSAEYGAANNNIIIDNAIPEPGTIGLITSAGSAALACRRRH